MSLLDAALDLAGHGFAVVPVRTDGSKAPAVDWKPYTLQPPARDTLHAWFGSDPGPVRYDGFGVICGAVSGQLEMLEVEGRAAHLGGALGRLLFEAGHADLWGRLQRGWFEQSPSGGLHWLYRVEGQAAPNTKLARRRNPENPRVVGVLLETRGEGGFVVTAPSAGRSHPSGKPWVRLAGGPATCPTITVEERDVLYMLATRLDEMPVAVDAVRSGEPMRLDGKRPGDEFNAQKPWAEILEPHGWTRVRKLGDGWGWTRPGKSPRDGISATTGTAADGVDRLYVFSTSTEFETETPYSKFAAHALLEHNGDYVAAARELGRLGYGSPMATAAERLTCEDPQAAQTAPAGVGSAQTAPAGGDAPGAVPIPPVEHLPLPPAGLPGEAEHMNLLERAIEAKLYDLIVADEARKRLVIRKEGDAPEFDAGTLAEMLARPPLPPERVEGLIPTGAFVLIVAERKTGKTTLTLGLTRCLLTGEEFLGRFPVRALEGRVGFLNYEVSGHMLARWANDAGIDPDRLVMANLRGGRNPLVVPDDRVELAKYLREQEVEALVVDPFSRAFWGKSQNDAAEVQPWLLDLDRFARTDVGASEVILTAHTGWGGERARGSSALEGHPDVTITLTRDEDQVRRYFKAEGRDVWIEEDQLEYDEATRSLTLMDTGSRKKAKARQKSEGMLSAILDAVAEHPGMNTGQLEIRLREGGEGFQRGDVGRAARMATESGHLVQRHGPNNSTLWYPRMGAPGTSQSSAGSSPRFTIGTGDYSAPDSEPPVLPTSGAPE